MSVATVFLSIEKGVEVAAEDLLKFAGMAQKASPSVLAALGVLAGALESSLTGVAGAASADGLNIALDVSTLNELKNVWPDVKAFLLTLGIKVS